MRKKPLSKGNTQQEKKPALYSNTIVVDKIAEGYKTVPEFLVMRKNRDGIFAMSTNEITFRDIEQLVAFVRKCHSEIKMS